MKRTLLMAIVSLILSLALLPMVSSAQMKYKEAPILAELVRAGKLPPVEERLPKEPLVLKPQEIGQYGGTLRQTHLGVGDATGWWRIVHEPLVYWDKDHKEIRPNVAKRWEISEGGKVFTFYLREGTKWSDGHPFTADDVMFWYKDIILNKELTPVVSRWFKVEGEVMKVEKVDDYTVRFRFVAPYGFFLNYLAGGEEPYAPKHYRVSSTSIMLPRRSWRAWPRRLVSMPGISSFNRRTDGPIQPRNAQK
ncbi:MAG: ABC transporter substrate-binding protein [bacterium]